MTYRYFDIFWPDIFTGRVMRQELIEKYLKNADSHRLLQIFSPEGRVHSKDTRRKEVLLLYILDASNPMLLEKADGAMIQS